MRNAEGQAVIKEQTVAEQLTEVVKERQLLSISNLAWPTKI